LWKVVEDRAKEEDEEEHRLTNGTILGSVMAYVDDIFIAASEPVMTAVKEKTQETRTTSVPEEVAEDPVRFLGVSILKVVKDGKETWMITQESYVKELVGKSDREEKEKKIPITKDQALMEPDEETPSLEKIRQCQKEVGEILWLVTRSRPDLTFSTSRMDSHVTKGTASVLETAKQIRGFQKDSGSGADARRRSRRGCMRQSFHRRLFFSRGWGKSWRFSGFHQSMFDFLAIRAAANDHLINCGVEFERVDRRDDRRRGTGSHSV
jgi:hypothetical protein